MDYKIDGRMIFLLIIILFLGVSFYSIVEVQERPHSKTEVTRILRQDFFKNKSEYQRLVMFAMDVNSCGDNWYLETNDKKELQCFSETPESLPVKIPAFAIPSGFETIFDTLQLSRIQYMKDGVCNKKNIFFNYRNDVFNPEDRTIIFRFFPDGLCRKMIEKINKSDNKWGWVIYLDKNWIAESVKKPHYLN